jgi:hypothetical protein
MFLLSFSKFTKKIVVMFLYLYKVIIHFQIGINVFRFKYIDIHVFDFKSLHNFLLLITVLI